MYRWLGSDISIYLIYCCFVSVTVRWWGENHECTFYQVVSAWPHLASSLKMKIHFLPGFHPFIFFHPSGNWGFCLISAVYSSYESKSWETFENVNPDNALHLISQSTKEELLLKGKKTNPTNIECFTSLPSQFYYVPTVFSAHCFSCCISSCYWSQVEKNKH